MASGRIKGITIEIGGDTTKLTDSLKKVDSSLKDTQAKLKDVNKLLKLDPTNVDLLRQKHDLLSKAVTDTKKRQEELKKALEQLKNAGDTEKNREQQDALQRELVETTVKLKDLEAEFAKSHPTIEAFSAGAKEVAEKTKKISAAAAGAAAGMIAMAVKSAASADDLMTMSNVTGLSVEELQKLQYASSFIDVSLETMTGSITKLTKNMASGSDVFDTLGVSITNADGSMRNATDVWYDAIAALGQVANETERDQLSMDLFGKSAMEMAGIVDDGGEALKSLGEEAENTGLIMSEDAVSAAVEFNDQMDKLKNTTTQAFFKMGSTLATTLMPMMEKLVNTVVQVVSWFGNLDGTTQTVILTVLGLVAAISPVASLLGNLNTIVTVLSTAFTALGGILGTTAITVGSLAVPFGAVIAIIGGLIAAGVLLYKNWDKITDYAKKLGTELKKKWEGIKKSISENATAAMKAASNAFTTLSSAISNKMNAVKSTVGNAFTNVVNSVRTAMSNAYNAVANSAIGSAAITVFTNVYNTVSTKMSEAYNKVTTFINNAVSAISGSSIVSVASGVFNSVKSTISSAFEGAKSIVQQAMDAIKRKIDNTNLDKDVHVNIYETTYQNTRQAANAGYVTPYASAYTNAVMFNRPTVLPTINGLKQFGDRGGSELVIGTNKLMNMIAAASSGGTTINMTVNGAGMNANEVADLAVNKITNQIMRRNNRW